MRISLPSSSTASRRSARAGFTMIEIAIAIGVIGFALVAIIGILPAGLNVQKETHQDTTIGQDGPFFLEAIRNGANNNGVVTSQNLDFLTNYVEQIQIGYTSFGTSATNGPVITYTPTAPAPYTLTNGQQILGLLSTPEFVPDSNHVGSVITNVVAARVHGLSGNATEQDGANNLVAFRYLMFVEVDRLNTSAYLESTNLTDQAIYTSLQNNLYDIRLKFEWPVIVTPGKSTIGPGRQTYRSIVSGQLLPFENNTNSAYWFFQPNAYSTNYTL